MQTGCSDINPLILIVDDEEKIVQVVRAYLEKSGYRVVSAQNGTDALEIYQSKQPDLLILDLMLPDISGEEICRRIRTKSRTPVIMLTAKVAEESLLDGFSMGADDYITKPFSPRELLVRVDAVLRRTSEKAVADIFRFDNDRIVVDLSKGRIVKDCDVLKLTSTEFQILEVFLKNPGRVFSRDDIIQFSFGGNFDGYDRTIDSHIKNLRGKLEDNPKLPRFIHTVHGRGYKFEV